jgi:hypothetical protein
MMYLSFDRLRYGKRRTGKGICATAILLLLPAVIHVCLLNARPELPNTANLATLYRTGAQHISAGVLPGLLGYLCNVGLGVIGTVIVGVFLLLLLAVLLVGLTPATLWSRLRDALQDKKEKTKKQRDREIELREERGLVVPGTMARRSADPVQREQEEMDRKILRRLDREQEKRELEAMREAERSDRMEKAGEAKRRRAEAAALAEDEMDPIDVLIRR